MAIRKIIKFPVPSLRKPCRPVLWPLSKEVEDHIQDLRDTLAATPNGVALSSNQIVAEGWRVFVVKSGLNIDLPLTVLNPRWQPFRDDLFENIQESCLSVPEINHITRRYTDIVLEYDYDTDKFDHIIPQDSFSARVAQHECDHLDGKLVHDYAPKNVQTEVLRRAIQNRKAGR